MALYSRAGQLYVVIVLLSVCYSSTYLPLSPPTRYAMLCYISTLYHADHNAKREKGVPNQENHDPHAKKKTNYISVSKLKGAVGVSGGRNE